MVTISHIVQKLVDKKIFIQESMNKNIISFASLAKQIQPEIEQESDNVFIYSSGPFAMEPGQSQRFSIALILGEDFVDLLNNAKISQQVFEADYRFAQAPKKPNLIAQIRPNGPFRNFQNLEVIWKTVSRLSARIAVLAAISNCIWKKQEFRGKGELRAETKN